MFKKRIGNLQNTTHRKHGKTHNFCVLRKKKKKQTRNCNTIKKHENRGGERLDAEIESNLTYKTIEEQRCKREYMRKSAAVLMC